VFDCINSSIIATFYYTNPPTSEGINRSCYYLFISLNNVFCNTRRYSLHKKKMAEKKPQWNADRKSGGCMLCPMFWTKVSTTMSSNIYNGYITEQIY
jgi:hypothetical protein